MINWPAISNWFMRGFLMLCLKMQYWKMWLNMPDDRTEELRRVRKLHDSLVMEWIKYFRRKKAERFSLPHYRTNITIQVRDQTVDDHSPYPKSFKR